MVVCNVRQAVFFYQLDETVRQSIACSACLSARVCLRNFLDSYVTCHSRQRIGSQSTSAVCLLCSACNACREERNVFSLAAYAACCRITACDDLTEYSKVRFDVEESLRAAETNSKTCDDFVEYKERAVLMSKIQSLLVVIEIDGTGT